MMVASTSVKDHKTVQFSLFKLIVSLNCALSGAHYLGRATSLFSCNGVFTSRVIFRYAFPAVSRSSAAVSDLQTVSKMNSISHCVIFAFPRMRKMHGVLRIADFLLSYNFPHKNYNYCLNVRAIGRFFARIRHVCL